MTMQWQSIESAPRDGTWILAYNPIIGVFKTRFLDGQWFMNGWDDKPGFWYPGIYAWMPLPTPPEQS